MISLINSFLMWNTKRVADGVIKKISANIKYIVYISISNFYQLSIYLVIKYSLLLKGK